MTMKAAVYHFTNQSEKRPIIYKKEVARLQDFAASNGWAITETYIDMSLKKTERREFDRFLSEAERYDILVVKDFCHLSKNTMACMQLLKELRGKGVEVHSIENGFFHKEDVPTDTPLKVATYVYRNKSRKGTEKAFALQEDIFSLYAEKKTNWTITGRYKDELIRQNTTEQAQLMQLIQDRDKFDMLLVANLNDINWRTATFCHSRDALALDIYSLYDGYLPYRKV